MYKDKTRDFRNEKLTAEQASEIKAAFDAGVAMCFAFDKGCRAPQRTGVISKILENHPDALIAVCDVFWDRKDPEALGDMILIIKKDCDSPSYNKMIDEIILPSKTVSQAIFIGKMNDKGVKRAVKRSLFEDDFSFVQKANLLVDGNKLLLTVRIFNPETDK